MDVVTSGGTCLEAFVPLHGEHQGQNVALAAEAAEAVLGGRLDVEASIEALSVVEIPGRVEVVSVEPVVVIDGAHNPDAARALALTLAESFMAAGRRILVMGALAGRDPRRFLAALNEDFPVDLVVPVALDGPRGLPASDIADAAIALDVAVLAGGSLEEGVASALAIAEVDDLVVVCGSFRVVDGARSTVASLRSR